MGLIVNEKHSLDLIVDEKSNIIANGKNNVKVKEEKSSRWKNTARSVGKFIWNSETREFLGRTAKSWG